MIQDYQLLIVVILLLMIDACVLSTWQTLDPIYTTSKTFPRRVSFVYFYPYDFIMSRFLFWWDIFFTSWSQVWAKLKSLYTCSIYLQHWHCAQSKRLLPEYFIKMFYDDFHTFSINPFYICTMQYICFVLLVHVEQRQLVVQFKPILYLLKEFVILLHSE